MNVEDINSLQERINRIALAGASPDIIIAPKPEVHLQQYATNFQVNRCTLLMLYNEFRGRNVLIPVRSTVSSSDTSTVTTPLEYRSTILHLGHIAATLANSTQELSTLIGYISDLLIDSGENVSEIERQTRMLFSILSEGTVRPDIKVSGVSSIPVHKYVAENAPSANTGDLRRVYSILKGTINMTGKILSIQAIIGGIMQAYIQVPLNSLYTIISRLEYDSSPLHMNQTRINESLEWYRERMDMKISQQAASFYEESLTRLMKIPTSYTSRDNKKVPIQMYAPQIELERLIIRPSEQLDLVDVISNTRTSPDLPIIVANVDGKKIIKAYNRPETMKKIELNWFIEARRDIKDARETQDGREYIPAKSYGMMNIVVRISRFPDRYQMIQYNSSKNYFSINRTEKYLSTSEIITLLCTHLGLKNLTAPQIASTTYSFVSNYIEGVSIGTRPPNQSDFGIDRHILAWLITNPPREYRNANLHRYVFVKEDTKPNSLRDHISIHIQLGTEKLYLTLSKHDTTSGTLVPVPKERQGEFSNLEERMTSLSGEGRDLIGFYQRQKYLQVRINKANSIHHARIAQTIYAHIISMYLKYYVDVRATIFGMTGISLPYMMPRLVPLNERVPDLREKYAFFDPVLYKYVSDISTTSLPVPIDREEAQYWIGKQYDVVRLPALVVNNPLIQFETSGEIWVRTPEPGRFILIKKKEGGYIPVLFNMKSPNGILISVNRDMTLTDVQNRPKAESYILKEYKSLSDKPGRLAYISKAALEMLTPIFPSNTLLSNVYRLGISMNILHALNSTLGRSVTPRQLAEYSYTCMQENWEQSVTEIAEDIISQRIVPIRHFRALEMAYKANIYFLVDDKLEPYLNKPPHAYFYLHRESRKEWPTLVFHSLSDEIDAISLITVNIAKGSRGYQHLFQGQEYLDDLMDRNNIVHMVSPAEGVNERLLTVPIRMELGAGPNNTWRAIEQVVDAYGKCRAITYGKRVYTGTQVATISIGFAPIQDLPLGDIKMPTMIGTGDNRVASIVQDLLNVSKDMEFAKTLSELISRPAVRSSYSDWAQMERDARILRIVTHLLYSQMNLSPKQFVNLIRVQRGLQYDTSNVKHALPNIQGSYVLAWEYFASILPGMVEVNPLDEDDYEEDNDSSDSNAYDDGESIIQLMHQFTINVPDEETRRALELHITSTEKMRWPMQFPSYVQYTYDIQSGREELVFLKEIDLIQYLIMSRAPTETSNIVISPTPYVLSRGDNKYLVQMASSVTHAKYIGYIWDTNEDGPLNPGYEGIISDVDFPWKEISQDFTDRIYDVSFTAKDGRIFVIIPI